MKFKIGIMVLVIILFSGMINSAAFFSNTMADTTIFICKEMLTRPTDKSININLVAEKDVEAFVEYGLNKANYPYKSAVVQGIGTVPFNIVLENLLPGTKYYYHVKYKVADSNDYVTRDEFSFTTQRAKGKSFSFAVEADPHLDNNTDPELYERTLQNILEGENDFLIDLGDSFMSEKEANKTKETTLQRHLLLRTYYDIACHSVSLFLVIGNHEGELGSQLTGTENCLPVWATQIRKQYYPNPIPDGFYSGNTKEELFVGFRQSYYSYEWGDALFVVIDPYWNTLTKQGDNWRFSLGKDQYDWFKNVLETSKAKFKFVFCHQIIGGKDTQGRGGSDYAQYYEMGGMNEDGTWGFDSQRKGWELPIHQLMVKNHVNVFFHGHDHFFVQQEKDGVTYQLVPQPGYPGNKSTEQAAEYGYLTGTMFPSSGYLKVTLVDSTAKIDYIKSYLPSMETSQKKNGMVEYSYTIKSKNSVTSIDTKNEVPTTTKLFQNYPNPFNPETSIQYTVAKAGIIQLKLYDTLGRETISLVDQFQLPGIYSVLINSQKLFLASGVYYYRMTSDNYSNSKKMILIK
jgi:hypothetical protein